MRPASSLLHMMLALAVLLCGLHIGEPAHAEDGAGAHAVTHAVSDTGHDDDEAPDAEEPAAHHHCPLAPTVSAPDEPAAFAAATSPPASPIVALRSLTRAPPTQPPAA